MIMSNTHALSSKMIAALIAGAGNAYSDVVADRRTNFALVRRGLVEVRTGRSTDHNGSTVYNVITAFKITEAGRAAVAGA